MTAEYVQIGDLVIPNKEWGTYVLNASVKTNAFYMSGVMAGDGMLGQHLSAVEGTIINLRHYNDLADTGSEIPTDDPADLITPEKMGTGQQKAKVQYRVKSWGWMDLAGEMGKTDPASAVGSFVGGWWGRDDQGRVLAMLKGVIAANVASNSGDMVYSVAKTLAAEGAPGVLNKMSGDVVIRAQQTMGDARKKLTAIAMHSALVSALEIQEQIITERPSSDTSFKTFKGMRVIEDDDMTVSVGGGGGDPIVFTSYLFGAGAIGHAVGAPTKGQAVATHRDERAGHGTGLEQLIHRKKDLMHIHGISWTDTSCAGISPTNAELATAGNWSRVWDRKKIPIVAIKTNG